MVVLVKRCVEQQSCIKLEKNDAAAATSFDSLGGGRSELLGSESLAVCKPQDVTNSG